MKNSSNLTASSHTENVVLVSLGQLVETNIHKSVNAFVALGISKSALIWHWIRPGFLNRFYGASNIGTLVDQYKSGTINTNNFRNTIIGLFPHLKITSQQFDHAWNAMCTISQNSNAVLRELNEINETGNKTIVISNTNPLHVSHIKNLFQDNLFEDLYLSYEKKKLGISLIQDCMANVKERYPNAAITFLHSPAPSLPRHESSLWGWLSAPVQKLFHAHAMRGHNVFIQCANNFNIQPQAWDIKTYQAGNLRQILGIGKKADNHDDNEVDVLNELPKPITPLATETAKQESEKESNKANPSKGPDTKLTKLKKYG